MPDRLSRAAHAQALIEALDLRDLTVVGHSEGGFLATRLALSCPERVRRLVIVASGATAPRLGGDRDAGWMAASSRVYDYAARGRDVEAFVAGESYPQPGRHDPAFAALLRDNFEAGRRSGHRECFLRLAAARSGFGSYAEVQERWIHPFLPALQVPALLVWGGADPTVPVERGLALAALFPQSAFHLFPRAGHWVMHEEPEAFARLVRAVL